MIGAVLGACVFALLVSNGGDGATTAESSPDARRPQAATSTTIRTADTAPDPIVEPRPLLDPPTTMCCLGQAGLPPPVAPSSEPNAGPMVINVLLARLRVEEELPRTGYDAQRFGDWSTGPAGCSVREQVLINESRTPAQVDPYGCMVVAGDWVSAYDGVVTDRPEDLEIDHVVALAEAWDSGARGWDDNRRRAFSNDLADPGALIAVTSRSNQAKSDRDPGSWQPANPDARCQFATDWVNVKAKWGLSADRREVEALRSMLEAHCPNGEPSGSVR